MRTFVLVLLFSAIATPAFAAAAYHLTDNDVAANAQEVIRTADNATIPNDPRNKDYQAYLGWLNKGNKPDVALMPPPAMTKLHPKP